jgi:hypothetical protein
MLSAWNITGMKQTLLEAILDITKVKLPCFGRHFKPLVLHLQSLAPTNPHWAREVGYSPLSLYVIHKEGLYPSSGDINRLMMKPYV